LLDRGLPIAGDIAALILEHFDATRAEDTGRFLSFGEQGEIPGRSGYLIGYMVAKNLGAHRALSELASLEGAELRKTMSN
jgi:hypothetical protein